MTKVLVYTLPITNIIVEFFKLNLIENSYCSYSIKSVRSIMPENLKKQID